MKNLKILLLFVLLTTDAPSFTMIIDDSGKTQPANFYIKDLENSFDASMVMNTCYTGKYVKKMWHTSLFNYLYNSLQSKEPKRLSIEYIPINNSQLEKLIEMSAPWVKELKLGNLYLIDWMELSESLQCNFKKLTHLNLSVAQISIETYDMATLIINLVNNCELKNLTIATSQRDWKKHFKLQYVSKIIETQKKLQKFNITLSAF